MTAAAAILRALGYAAFALELPNKSPDDLAAAVRHLEKASQNEGNDPVKGDPETEDYRHD